MSVIRFSLVFRLLIGVNDLTRRADALNEFAFEPVRYRTNQYSRSFIPALVDKWNRLGNSVFDGVGIGSFKTLVNRSLFG